MAEDELKRAVSTALGKTTKQRNVLRRMLNDTDDPVVVQSALDALHGVSVEYQEAHGALVGALVGDDKEKECERFFENEDNIAGTVNRATTWLERVEIKETTSSQKNREDARCIAAMVAKQKLLAKRMELARRKHELEDEEELLRMQAEIDDAKAERDCFTEEERVSEPVRKNVMNSSFMDMGSYASDTLNVSTSNAAKVEGPLDPNAQAFSPGNSFSHPLPAPSQTKHASLSPPVSSAPLHIPDAYQHDLIAALTLPKPELIHFDGDVMGYHAFIYSFDFRIGSKHMSDNEKLHFLHQFLKGEPRDLISGCFHMPFNGYQEARNLLSNEYGHPYKLAMAYMDRLTSWQVIKNEDADQLKKLSCFITRCLNAMNGVKYLDALDHPDTLRAVVQKLPVFLRNKWSEKAHTILCKNEKISLSHLSAFIQTASGVANNPMFGKNAMSKPMPTLKKENQGSFATEVKRPADNTSNFVSACFFCNRPGHKVQSCTEFLRLDLEERRNAVKAKRLCFACFGKGHMSSVCKRRLTCELCNRNHPTAMHYESSDKNAQTRSKNGDSVSVACNAGAESNVFHAMLPVIVKSKNSDEGILTYCFLDNGSSGCFMTSDLFDELKLSGVDSYLQMSTMHGISREPCVVVSGLSITDPQGNSAIELPKVYSRPRIPMDESHLARRELCDSVPQLKEYAHLLPTSYSDVPVGLLIGSNCKRAIEPLQVTSSQSNPLFAVRYRHGWTVQGSTGAEQTLSCNRIVVSTVEKEILTPHDVLNSLQMDFDDRSSTPDERAWSVEDRRFMTFVDDSIKFADKHYVVPLPIRDRAMSLPNNRSQALSRLVWQGKKMASSDVYKRDYKQFMQNLMEKGYCEPVPESASSDTGNVWYLPHHGVYHPQKKKIRIVFDCSARFRGLSLNDHLLQGPDLTNNLFGALTRFRFHPVAFVADLEAMFYQVRVPERDRSFLRFLWWDSDGEVQEFQMTVHIFGAVSSPSVANYVIKRIAATAPDDDIRDTLSDNFYVDDCLKSVPSENECVSLIERLCATCKDSGFRLTKFLSNNRSVINAIPCEEHAKDVVLLDLVKDDLPVTRALGVIWRVEEDQFGFSVKVPFIDCAQPLTRRSVLSVICSLYDPLGFVAPVVLEGKILLQALCEGKVDWDEPLSGDLAEKWLGWLNSLHALNDVRVSRCFISGPNHGSYLLSAQLHVFCDASSLGYGAVAYLRMTNCDGNVQLTFVAGKSRVAPVKIKTIPRLELTAATVSVRLACMIVREMKCELRVIYHTDSTVVLHCIRNEQKRFPVFFANRIQLIRDFTRADQWRHVPTHMNPADEASRGVVSHKLMNAMWLRGPDFLLNDESEWPCHIETACVSDMQELCVTVSCVADDHNATDDLILYFSSWTKLCRAVAVFRRVQKLLLRRVNGCGDVTECRLPLSGSEIDQAEKAIFKWVQKSAFSAEYDLLSAANELSSPRKQKQVMKKSNLYRLNPFIDDEGFIRLGGRLRRTDWAYNEKHPVILPSKHAATLLFIRNEHERLGHAGRNHVLSSTRSKYWVIHGNAAVRRVISSCVRCKRSRGCCQEQQMADLPDCRVDDSSSPFSHVGVDYFGPFSVKQGRKSVKCYGVIFTCMSSRAIHLEIAPSLDTTSFINALRRFMARRGPVVSLYSDNGTNFVGTNNEMKQALKEMNNSDIQKWSANFGMTWHFNPPYASHMGGVWERAIRTVRQVLFGLMQEISFTLDADTLHTLFCEVENIVNSRPLSSVSSDSTDPEPLSPSHILTMKSKILLPPPGNFQRADLYMRKRWRRVQYLANMFWSRWRNEYLKFQQSRSKWPTLKPNLKVGDVVLLKESDLPRNMWPLAVVTSVECDDKGVVRSVFLKSRRDSALRRPVHKLVWLFSNA